MYTAEIEAIMTERFGGDCLMALATSSNNVPHVRTVNAHYEDGCFYVITYAQSGKMQQISKNPIVALSGNWFTCHGEAVNLGWFREAENTELATKLKKAFAEWIDNGHNNFDDENTIILCIRITSGLLLSHGRRFELLPRQTESSSGGIFK